VQLIAPLEGEVFTHQLLIPMGRELAAAQAIAALESRGVLVGTCADPTTPGGYALRVGTQYVSAHTPCLSMDAIGRRLANLLVSTSDNRMTVA
jgi:glycine hydroxymethyltransferase